MELVESAMPSTGDIVFKLSAQRMACTRCGSEVNANCNCGVSYVPKPADRARQIAEKNPSISSRSLAEMAKVSQRTAANVLSGEQNCSPDRIGKDGKSYSLKKRVVDDLDIPAEIVEMAAATGRRRVFLRCAEDAIRKAEQGAGLKDAREREIDDEILIMLDRIVEAWSNLRDEILSRKGE